ncbi:MAG: hypothetical protein Q9159_002000 [Coniocarpon cinnabarinum]
MFISHDPQFHGPRSPLVNTSNIAMLNAIFGKDVRVETQRNGARPRLVRPSHRRGSDKVLVRPAPQPKPAEPQPAATPVPAAPDAPTAPAPPAEDPKPADTPADPEKKDEPPKPDEAQPADPKPDDANAEAPKADEPKADDKPPDSGFTPEQDAQLKQLKDEKKSWKVIATIMGIEKGKLQGRFRDLMQAAHGGDAKKDEGKKDEGKKDAPTTEEKAAEARNDAKPEEKTEGKGKGKKNKGPAAAEVKPNDSDASVRVLEPDDLFDFEDLQVLVQLCSGDEDEKWERVASRFFDRTGRRVYWGDIRESLLSTLPLLTEIAGHERKTYSRVPPQTQDYDVD